MSKNFGDQLSMGTNFLGDHLSMGTKCLGTICPGGPIVLGTICPWGPNVWGPIVQGDQLSRGPNEPGLFVLGDQLRGTKCPGTECVRDQMRSSPYLKKYTYVCRYLTVMKSENILQRYVQHRGGSMFLDNLLRW